MDDNEELFLKVRTELPKLLINTCREYAEANPEIPFSKMNSCMVVCITTVLKGMISATRDMLGEHYDENKIYEEIIKVLKNQV